MRPLVPMANWTSRGAATTRAMLASTFAAFLSVACASTPPARTDCAAQYWPGTVEYGTCYGNIDRQQTEMLDSMEWQEGDDALSPLGGAALVPPP